MTETTSPPAGTPPEPARSSTPVISLVLGIVGLVACCHVLGPVAWILGAHARGAMRAGRMSSKDETLATIGMVLGIIQTLLFACGLLWILFFGGMAFLGAMLGGHH